MLKKEYIEKIRKNFPNIKFIKSKLITAGYDDDVVILDNKIVFSFPKKKLDCLEKFQRELEILPLLNKKISLSIPNFIYISKDKTFGGYKFIKGKPLTKNILKKLTMVEKNKIAKQLGMFLNQLHSFPIKINKSKLVLIHGDLIDEHVLFDDKTKKISGIIDFGDAQIANPALEFSRIWRFGENFFDLVLKYYKSSKKLQIKKDSYQLWVKND